MERIMTKMTVDLTAGLVATLLVEDSVDVCVQHDRMATHVGALDDNDWYQSTMALCGECARSYRDGTFWPYPEPSEPDETAEEFAASIRDRIVVSVFQKRDPKKFGPWAEMLSARWQRALLQAEKKAPKNMEKLIRSARLKARKEGWREM